MSLNCSSPVSPPCVSVPPATVQVRAPKKPPRLDLTLLAQSPRVLQQASRPKKPPRLDLTLLGPYDSKGLAPSIPRHCQEELFPRVADVVRRSVSALSEGSSVPGNMPPVVNSSSVSGNLVQEGSFPLSLEESPVIPVRSPVPEGILLSPNRSGPLSPNRQGSFYPVRSPRVVDFPPSVALYAIRPAPPKDPFDNRELSTPLTEFPAHLEVQP